IREELFQGKAEKGLKLCGFNDTKPILMMMGGSLGSVAINTVLRKALPALLPAFNIIHICGKNNKDESLENTRGYKQFEYVKEELPHLFAAADIFISRAGANSIAEILSMKKPNILIPLSARASRGDQILNARSFKKQGFSQVLEEENLTEETLIQMIKDTYRNRHQYIESMGKSKSANGIDIVMDLIRTQAKR
ncbi:MAG: UDP-N-acetylglucosamine--N-acetylmuramyl-(pentapeptide) pyrophosphoryl-undecaprenol N-acetylglucosamine transferase, partial [Epulopiscium sp.]|nr:UDP-N-acetylglucosamine--N-acetylmuramyl-(pentapeptide) pyrophosphoryl-undecaprenol N-acetylglucosamine transferase [Candidatus Epulonipiscium sp.]